MLDILTIARDLVVACGLRKREAADPKAKASWVHRALQALSSALQGRVELTVVDLLDHKGLLHAFGRKLPNCIGQVSGQRACLRVLCEPRRVSRRVQRVLSRADGYCGERGAHDATAARERCSGRK